MPVKCDLSEVSFKYLSTRNSYHECLHLSLLLAVVLRVTSSCERRRNRSGKEPIPAVADSMSSKKPLIASFILDCAE